MASISDRLRQLQQEQDKPVPAVADPTEARNIRTHRLVQLGALAEQYLEVKGIEPTEFESFLLGLVKLPVADNYIHNHRRSG